MIQWRNKFNALADEVQVGIQETVELHLGAVSDTLDMIRSENVALESERNPEFRQRVDRATRTALADIRRFQEVFGL